MKYQRLISIFAIILVCAPGYLLSEESQSDPVTISEIKDHIYFLASDFLLGRETASEGLWIANNFVASQFQRAGLEPLFTVDSKKSYFQEVKFKKVVFSPESTMRISNNGSDKLLKYHESFFAVHYPAAFADGIINNETVFAGFGIEEPDLGWDDYKGLNLEGKTVIILSGAPVKDGKPVLPDNKHALYSNIGHAIKKKAISVLSRGAATILFVLDENTEKMYEQISGISSNPFKAVKMSKTNGNIDNCTAVFIVKPGAIKDYLLSMGYDYLDPESIAKPVDLVENILIKLTYEKEEDSSCHNVGALLKGNSKKTFVVSAHLDHLGSAGDRIFNGADDNASGVVAMIESAENLVGQELTASVAFITFTGEEGSLTGSTFFIQNLPVNKEHLLMNINLDMVGGTNKPYENSIVMLGKGYDLQKLDKFCMDWNSRNDIKVDHLLEKDDSKMHLGGSDQVSFVNIGIPVTLMTSGFMGPNYHKHTDDPQTVNFQKIKAAAMMLSEFILSFR